MRKAAEGRKSPMEGRNHAPEAIEKIRRANLGKKRGPMSVETRRKLSAAMQDKSMRFAPEQPALEGF